MSFCHIFFYSFAVFLLQFPLGLTRLLENHYEKIEFTNFANIFVGPLGEGNFTTIQAAINTVPSYGTRWTCIHIKQGLYREKVTIPIDKPFIYLKGEGYRKTIMFWDGHDNILTGATFTSRADNVIAKDITFMNSYNYPLNNSTNPIVPAVAALIEGDKSAFYECAFLGVQDTLWDVQGRHYFKLCTIQGAVDFIFGAGQSVYEECTISVVAGVLNVVPGYITAQGRSAANETNGFVFKDCNITGNGMTYLGRPWREYATVLFYGTSMSDIVVPQGWDPWSFVGHEYTLSLDEAGCYGIGANISKRVNWANKMNQTVVQQLIDISYINDGTNWLSNYLTILDN